MKKMLFFINPNAGHSGIRQSLLEVLKLFCSAYEVRVYTTSGPREITRIIEQQGAQYDIIVSAGGDGTLNETVAGLAALPNPPVLGYIPAGTVNDVAASLGLPLNPVLAAQQILKGEAIPLDLGSFNGRPFTYVAAFGAFTKVSYATPQDMKRALGRLAYLLAGAKALGEIRPIRATVRANGKEETGDFIFGMVCSTKSVGGFRAKNVRDFKISLNDGLSEAVFVRDIRNLQEFGDIAGQILRMDFTDPKHFFSFQTDHVEVELPEEVAWTLDGEDGGSWQHAEICNLPHAIQIMAPKG